MGISPFYTVTIQSSVYGTVRANLPKSFVLQVASEWDSLLSSGPPGIVDAGTQAVTGRSLVTQEMSAQRWSGNTPIELELYLEFEAETDAAAEVVNPVRTLTKMALPSKDARPILQGLRSIPGIVGSHFLRPPGPKMFNLSGTGDNIYIKIGRYIVFKKVIITNVESEFSGRMSPDGQPMGASVNLNFRTFFSPTAQDIDEMLFT